MTASESLAAQPLRPLVDWATTELAARNIEVRGDGEEVRRRPWSLVARLPTDIGTVWLKANARAFAHEGPLVAELARLQPGLVLAPLAVHRANGWLVSRDGGETLSPDPVFDRIDVPDGWPTALRAYAVMQQHLSDHIDELRATGVAYLPPEQLVTVYDHYADRAPGLRPGIEHAAAKLARYGRLTLEHNDLHPGHVFTGTGALLDWADAAVTHPFLSMRVLGDPAREHFFDQWREVGPVTVEEITLAESLAPLIGLHPWRTIDTSAEPYDSFVRELLGRLHTSFSPAIRS